MAMHVFPPSHPDDSVQSTLGRVIRQSSDDLSGCRRLSKQTYSGWVLRVALTWALFFVTVAVIGTVFIVIAVVRVELHCIISAAVHNLQRALLSKRFKNTLVLTVLAIVIAFYVVRSCCLWKFFIHVTVVMVIAVTYDHLLFLLLWHCYFHGQFCCCDCGFC